MINYLDTIISEYANSPTLRGLIQRCNEFIDPATNFDDFYKLVWNVDTAEGYGLDVWGRIVGVGRVLQLASVKYFGFSEATSLSADPFNQSPFYSGQPLTSNYALLDQGYRTLILAKALANICNCSVPAINQILLNLFPGRGNCYVTDNLDMTMTYRFHFLLTQVEAAIVIQSGVLPRPAGVKALFVQTAS